MYRYLVPPYQSYLESHVEVRWRRNRVGIELINFQGYILNSQSFGLIQFDRNLTSSVSVSLQPHTLSQSVAMVQIESGSLGARK